MKIFSRLMDGSLFFRALTACMNFLRDVAAGSFIAGLFAGEECREKSYVARKSIFMRVCDKVLNCAKPFSAPKNWPSPLSNVVKGSWLARTAAEGIDAPVPPPVEAAENANAKPGARSVFAWMVYAFPAVGLAVIIITAPLLPTMALAGMMVPVIIFVFLSRRFEITYMAAFLLAFMAVNFFAGAASFEPRHSLQIALITSVFAFAALLIPAVCRTRKSVDFFFIIFLAGAGIVGIVGLWQLFAGLITGVGAWVDDEMFVDIGYRLYSTWGNPNVYGTYLLLAIPLAAACVAFFKNKLLKICAGGLALILLFSLLQTYSRGNWLALAFAFGVFVLIIEKRLVVTLIPAVLALPFILPPAVINRFLSIFYFGVEMDGSTAFRISIYQASVRIIRDFGAVGVGQGPLAYNSVFLYYAPHGTRALHAHNLYMQTWIALGIVGLVVLIAVLACWFKYMVNFIRRTAELRLKIVAAAFICAVIAFLFQGIFDYPFYNYRMLLVFYIFLGLGAAFAKAYEREEPL